MRSLWLAFRDGRGRVDGQRLAGCGPAARTEPMYAWEENHKEYLERLHREHEQFMRSLRRGRYSFFTLLGAWGIYVCVIPFLCTPEHVMIALAVFLLFALQFIVISLRTDSGRRRPLAHPRIERRQARSLMPRIRNPERSPAITLALLPAPERWRRRPTDPLL